MRELVSTEDMSEEVWLEARRQGIGSSDAPAVCRVSKYKSPVDVWLDKLGRAPEREQSEAAKWGLALEKPIADEVGRRLNTFPERQARIYQHDKFDWMLANLDFTLTESGSVIPLEIKNMNAFSASDWEEGPPSWAECQVQHQLAVTGAPYAYIAALIGGQKLVTHKIERNDEVIAEIETIEREFWENHVLKEIAPPFDEADTETLNLLFPKALHDTPVELTIDAEQWAAEYLAAHQREKEAQSDKKKWSNKLRGFLGENKSARNEMYKVSWGNISSKRFNEKGFKEDFEHIYLKYLDTKEYRRMSVTEVGDKQ